ncbi:phosphatidylcholine synthase [Paroceanicella profunda]|uniref:Phosphatidylcholine synthase n=1 Tax=Paroceanicella profunda TaxID=2579971 RepID=A0A5B8FXB2_9RHOB|nr:CDP-alcohol phosphatidyltransferase family protein [Paroceanicella profunda]QDL91122.1 phosphatidylcholine synthase [Paroceanicella profunda]
MTKRLQAFSVHLLTATGAVFALLAMFAAARQDWSLMYIWLVVALAVDGIDGPLARHYEVKSYAPQWDGVLMDLIIDFLTYVFIPAFALVESGLLPGWAGWFTAILITFSSVVYFADTRMKTSDNSFSGFPGCWNMVILVFFATEPAWWTVIGLSVILALAQFFPIKFVHPVRTDRWRAISLPAIVLWTGFAGWAAAARFDPPVLCTLGLLVTSAYLLGAGAAQQVFPPRTSGRRA